LADRAPRWAALKLGERRSNIGGEMSFDAADAGVPAAPPPVVLDAVAVAAQRAEEMASEQRELHFERDRTTGRVIVRMRDLRTGEVILTLPPSRALEMLSDGAL
jgi:FlaG protein